MSTGQVVYNKGGVSVKVSGLENVRARLNQLEVNIRRRLLIDVMKRSLQKSLLEAQSRAPMGTSQRRRGKIAGIKNVRGPYSTVPGALKRSFVIKKMRSNNPFLLEVQLQNTSFYALWIEYGHRIVRGSRRTGSRRVVGNSPAQPFMRPTFESQKESIITQVANEIGLALTRRGV